MSDCVHCDIHDFLEPELAREGANLSEVAGKVSEVLADLVLSAAPDDRGTLLADIIAISVTSCSKRASIRKPAASPNRAGTRA